MEPPFLSPQGPNLHINSTQRATKISLAKPSFLTITHTFKMGNAGTRMRAKNNERVVRVTNKLDGKTLEFHAPVLVKDLLRSHPNCYVGAFREATQPLPPNYKLRVGRLYYLLACNDCNTRKIKVVITKQQLRRLMARQMGLDEVLLDGSNGISGSKLCRVMDTIPEGVVESS